MVTFWIGNRVPVVPQLCATAEESNRVLMLRREKKCYVWMILPLCAVGNKESNWVLDQKRMPMDFASQLCAAEGKKKQLGAGVRDVLCTLQMPFDLATVCQVDLATVWGKRYVLCVVFFVGNCLPSVYYNRARLEKGNKDCEEQVTVHEWGCILHA